LFRFVLSAVVLGVAALLPTLLVGCARAQPLLPQVAISRDALTPSGTDRVDLSYTLTRPARVTLLLEMASGQQVPLRSDEPRPAAGTYIYPFDGTYPSPDDPEERRVLAGGTYRLLLEARDNAGQSQRAATSITIRDADTSPPAIGNLVANPNRLSPNFDGVDDVVSVTYRLAERARVFAFATDQSGRRVYLGRQELLEPGEYREVWDGTFKDRPLPDGQYQFSIRATDLAGNVSLARTPVVLEGGGRPDARILRIELAPRRLMVGDELRVTATVKNV
jgi:CHU_C Type IX secretion signal domain